MMIITLEQSLPTEQPPFQAVLRFPHGSAYSLMIIPPFSAKEESELAWYFEQHLKHPYMDQVRAEQVANAIQRYGESLFKQVFADQNAYGDYRDALRSDGFELQIMGQPAFHALHWESLKDPQHPPLALSQSLVRKPLGLNRPFQPIQPQESPVLNVLLVVARPRERQDVGYRTISRPLVEMVRDAKLRVNIEILRPATFQALSQHLETVNQEQGKGFYHLIHFDVHGAVLDYASLKAGQESGQLVFYDTPYGRSEIKPYDGKKAFLFLVGETKHQAAAIEADTITALLQRHGIPMVVLNACQSAKQDHTATETSLASRLMQAGTQWVVAMAYSVTVSAAELFMRQWYQQLFAQRSLAQATQWARLELKQQKSRKAYRGMQIDLEDWLLPVVYQSAPVTLPLRTFTPKEEQDFFEQAANRFQSVNPRYGFFGRDLDILAIENRLLRPDGYNLLLVQGLGGAGKTTLLTHLGEWWQTTRLVKEVFYFGYDERAWTAQQMMAAMARQLWGKQGYQQGFQAFSEEAQVQKLAQTLRATRHLLIIDNLESVTGKLFAIQHVLSASKQAKLKTLLQALAGGKTLVLLGSRGEEAWLAEGTFAQRRYELGGLDAEAASNLAAKILRDCGASHDQKDPQYQADLRKLFKLLQGFPLALQVVLENLRTRTPAQILEALFKGEAQIDFNSPDKTKSLLKCIEYSHSNLSVEAQQLLLCLSPFVGVMNEEWLPHYTKQLTQHPELAQLPFTRWKEVLQEASRWGLITAHEAPGYLRLQPIFPYFLQNRLQAETLEFRRAIDRAFRGYYEQVGTTLYQLMQSNEPSERQQGQSLTKLEFENLSVALQSMLQEQGSIQDTYLTLWTFLDQTKTYEQGIVLSRQVLVDLEKYPPEAKTAYEKIIVVGSLANHYLSIQQYAQAVVLYQQNLAAIDSLQGFEANQIGYWKATAYHQLGRVAEEQQQWETARENYQWELHLKIEFNDRYGQAITYHHLGKIAQKQQQWESAKESYQRALNIKIEFNDRYGQASTYHQLGRVAQAQRQWESARENYQRALDFYIEFNDRYEQASTYHNLGSMTQAQQQWETARDYYQRALDIYIELNARHGQASTYHQLGLLAKTQEQWQQAAEYLFIALEIFIEYSDEYRSSIALNNLNCLHTQHPDLAIPEKLTARLEISVEEVLERFKQLEQSETT